MRYRTMIATLASCAFAMVFVLYAFGQEMKPIQLPEPKLDSSKSLAQALKDRKTSREYSGDKLP
ncbi:MAG: hypothetical protein ACLQPD_12725, partial [Desulfomonilaceae bacterium]